MIDFNKTLCKIQSGMHIVTSKKELTGCPIVTDNIVVVMEIAVKQCVDLSTHTLFIGKCLSAKNINDGDAMTYEYYHTVIKGKTHKNAPTYNCN